MEDKNMKKILYISVVTFLALVSCNKKIPEISDGQVQFRISLPQTKATASAFENGDAVSLYAVAYDGAVQMPLQIGGNWVNNERLTFNGSSWTPDRAIYWPDGACDFYAFYPYQPSIGSMEKYPFSVAVDQNTARTVDALGGYEASDLLYASCEGATQAGGAVNLAFHHMMSKLIVSVELGPNFEGEIPNDIVAHVYNTVTDCTVDWTKGSVEKNSFGAKNTITMKKLSNSLFEAVLVPQNIEKRTPLIELTMGGIAYLLEYSLSFRPGYVHTVTLTLNTSPDQEQIEISIDPGINNWN